MEPLKKKINEVNYNFQFWKASDTYNLKKVKKKKKKEWIFMQNSNGNAEI